MYLLWYCFMCIGIAFIMASFFEQKFEMAIITAHCAIISVLFIFYVLNILNIGFYLVCSLFGIGVFCGIYKSIRFNKVKSTLKLVWRPAAMIYFMLLFFVYLTVRMNTVNLIDELHLWGALPKILFIQNGRLQLENTMLLGFQDYIPGMSLWLFFLERLNGQFSEALLYFGYAALGGAMLLPMCERISDYKKWYVVPIISIIMYLLPLTFYNSIYNDWSIYYKSLHVDAILGLTLCYVTWILQKKPWKSLISMTQFSLGLTILVLIKSSGIVFAIILTVSMLFYLNFVEKMIFKKRLFWIVLPFVAYVSWRVCLTIYGVEETVAYSIKEILAPEGIKEFCRILLSHSILQPRNTHLAAVCTFSSLLMGILFIYFVWWLTVRYSIAEKRIAVWIFVTMIIQIVVFIIGLYGLYVGAFQSNMLSCPRYLCTILTAFFTFWFYNFIYEFGTFRLGLLRRKIGLIVLLLSIAVFYPLYRPLEIQYPQLALRDADKIETIIISSEDVYSKEKFSTAALIVDSEYNSFSPDLHLYLWRRLYFDLLDENIQVKGFYFDTDIKKIQESKNELKIKNVEKSLWKEYDYVIWLHYVDDSEKNVEMYQVISANENIVYLQRVNAQKVNDPL